MTPPTDRRRAIFLDVDGTIVDHGDRMQPSTIEAVRLARAAGHLVLLSTGRAPAEIFPSIREIGFDGFVSAGGGFTEFGGELRASRTMTHADLDAVIDLFEATGIEYILQGFVSVYPSGGVPARLRELAGDLDLGEWAQLAGDGSRPDPAALEPISKATFFGRDATTFATVRDGLGERFHVLTGSMPMLGEAGGEVSPYGVHKGAAVLDLVTELGIPVDDVVAIGDSVNDLEMFDVAGLAIAMGNADGSVKERADEVTTSVHEDGVWNAFQRHGLLG